MIVLLDTSESLDTCASELGCGVGQLLTPLTRFRWQADQRPWAIDNGGFSRFDEKAFMSLLEREEYHKDECLFVVSPDVVGSARRTLEIFERWKNRLSGWKIALCIQDGQQDLPIPWPTNWNGWPDISTGARANSKRPCGIWSRNTASRHDPSSRWPC